MNDYQEYVRNGVESTRRMYEQQQAYKKKQQMLARKKQQRRAILTALAVVAGTALVIFFLGTLFGWHLGTKHAVVSTLVNYETTQEPPVLHSDLIKADSVLLPYDLQEFMYLTCQKYGVPTPWLLLLPKRKVHLTRMQGAAPTITDLCRSTRSILTTSRKKALIL